MSQGQKYNSDLTLISVIRVSISIFNIVSVVTAVKINIIKVVISILRHILKSGQLACRGLLTFGDGQMCSISILLNIVR